MRDRELLELAAKAAGLDRPNYIQDGFALGWQKASGIAVESGATSGRLWNPLTDDGDALRLAVKLNLTVYCFKDGAQVMLPGIDMHKVSEKNTDVHAATRRAIVRAAAEIGRMKND